jgi:hypothetical protein
MTPSNSKRTRNAIFIALLLSAIVGGCKGPLVLLPGGALEGATVPAPADWSFTDEIEVVQLETNPSEPYSVNIWVIAEDGSLYVHSGTNHATWIENMEADPRVRLQANDSIYELVASRVQTQAEFDRFITAYVKKYENPPRNPLIGDVYLYRLVVPESAM